MSLFKVTPPPAKITRLRHSKGQSGQALAEVALILALICVVTIVAMTATGTSIDGLLDTITGVLGGDLVPGGGDGDDTPGGDVGGGSGGGGAEGALSMPAGTTQGALVNLADDGTITAASSIGANTYRVLSMSGGTAKLLKMQAYGSNVQYNASSVTTSFGSYTGLKYEGSNLDSVMNTFYESLPEAVKAAIVPQNINQSMYAYQSNAAITADAVIQYYDDFSETPSESAKRGLRKVGEVNVGSRSVWALDVADVIEYFGGGFNCRQLNELFFGAPTTQSKTVWLRSASSGGSNSAFTVVGSYGNLSSYYFSYGYDAGCDARPAFIINIAA